MSSTVESFGEEPIYYRPKRRPLEKGGETRQFAEVLSKLASDPGYRERAVADPATIAIDYKLTLKELQSLRQVAILSGADITNVNKLRAEEMLQRIDAAYLDNADVDVSCCSCCCCCCGETAVVA